MGKLDKWGRGNTSSKPFYGFTLGYQEWNDININESAIQVRIVDCTHKIFLFELHFGADGTRVSAILDRLKGQSININTQIFPIIWTWGKRLPILRKLVINRKVYYYAGSIGKFFDIGTFGTNVEGELGLSIRGLGALLNSWQDDYRGQVLPEIPKEYHDVLKRLEWECKEVSKEKEKCVSFRGNWRGSIELSG